MFHMDIVRINKKLFVCTQIIRHDKTQNLVTIKHKVRKKRNTSYGPKHVIFVTLLIH